MNALETLRKAKVYISPKKAGLIVGKSDKWVKVNKHRFGSMEEGDFKKEGPKGKLYAFELSAVIRVAAELKEEFKNLRYQRAS